MTNDRTVTPKTLALAALTRAIEEAKRPDLIPLVLVALLEDARAMVEQIAELKRARKRREPITGPSKRY